MIGFDNLQFARACSPKLTIVSQPTQDIGIKAANIMLKRLGEIPMDVQLQENEKITEKLKTSIIQGKSICKISKS